jgi:hypothetical protein
VPEFRYEPIPEMSEAEIYAALAADDPEVLLYAVLSAALYGEPVWAAQVCAQLATHGHFNVRGNALLGFAHLARLHGGLGLDRSRVEPLIRAGLEDPDAYVRGHAGDAADDVAHYLGWRLRPNPLQDWHDGLPVAGARFMVNDRVMVVGDDQQGEQATVVWLLEVEPAPLYLVELASGRDIQVYEQALRPVG